ncbi:family 16 glycosylhydrolase [Thomasclavelia sp.]|uniref:family 16 glycosylhydrolase n=1 Tax=Thomasclavelia sp. TaxID=3025757 RepID=UPI0025CD2629|nr:family 16 glycosylhydrolase [Thomasclavelia sp.]
MKKTKKVLIASALVLSTFAAAKQTWQVNAAPTDLVVNGNFEELQTSSILTYSGNPSDMEYSNWYSEGGGVVSYVGNNESERSGMLPANKQKVWLAQVVKVKKNTDYVFSAYVRTSLAGGSGILQVLDANTNKIEGIDEVWTGGTEWKHGTVSFNSGNHEEIVIRVLKWTDEKDTVSDIYKSEVYVDDAKLFTKADYEEYQAKQETKTKLTNYIKNSDLINVQSSDILKNNGDTYSYESGKFYYNGDVPAVIGEGYGENAYGLVLPENVEYNSLKALIDGLKQNTDYVFKVYLKHGSDNTKTVTNINALDGTSLFKADDNIGYSGGVTWKEYTYPFNSGSFEKAYVDIYKYYGNSTASISDMRVYEKAEYDKYLEEIKEEEQEAQDKLYTEVWRDEFDTLDMNSWSYQLGHKRGIEPQEYVDSSENVFVEDGKLILRATKKHEYTIHYNADGSDIVKKYDSGSIATFGKREFLYGKIEMRAKLPKGAGAFPAFWTLGNDFTLDGLVASDQGVGWPMCGEIDIMELIGENPDMPGTSDRTVHGTIHNGLTEDGDKAQTNTYSLPEKQTFNDEYHTFSIIWNPDTIQWYVDDNLYSTVYITDLDYFHKPHYLLLNLAAGGAWPGFPNDQTQFPMDFVIDYVSYSQTKEQKAAADKYYETCPTINGVKDITISSEDELQSLLSNVSAKDYNGNDLEVYCSVNNGTKLMWNGKTRTSEIDFSKEGTYEIVYSTVGESNIYTREIATLHVK